MLMSILRKSAPAKSLPPSKVEKRLRSLQNEMEFLEILAQFWPWPNMILKVERLQREIQHIRQQAVPGTKLRTG
jgi:hypothetical protein